MTPKVFRLAAVPLIVALVIGYFTFLSAGISLRPLELRMRDKGWRFLFASGGSVRDDRIVIIGIDKALREDPRFTADSLAWRGFHARLVDRLTAAGAAVIGFDLFFERQNPVLDDFLVDSLRKSGKVVLGRRVADTARVSSEPVQLAPLFRAFPCALCVVPRDEDRVIRRAFTVRETGDPECRDSFAMALARRFRKSRGESGEPSPSLDRNGFFSVRFAAPPKAFIYADYRRVLDATDDELKSFEGKAVLVGDTGGEDVLRTPLGRMNGVEFHAHVLSSLLRGEYATCVPDRVTALLIVVMALFTAALDYRLGYLRALVVVAVAALLYTVACYAVFVWTRTFIPLVAPLAAMGVTFAALVVWRNEASRKALGYFVPKAFLDRLLEKRIEEKGEEREVTVLFSDLRGFTTLSEKSDAASIMEQLNVYNQTMQAIVTRHGGYVSSLQGDALMVIFGALRQREDHAMQAVEAARAMHEALGEMNGERAQKGLEPLACGVGINTGICAIGFLGTAHHLEFAAIGDTTNTASRLQSLCRDLDCRIIISESAYEKVKGRVSAEKLPPAMLKGKAKAVQAYKVL